VEAGVKGFVLHRVLGGMGFLSQPSVGDPPLVGTPAIGIGRPTLSWLPRLADRLTLRRGQRMILLTGIGLVAGVLAVARWQSQDATPPAALASRHTVTQQTIDQLEAEQTQLKKQIADLRANAEVDQQRLLRTQSAVASLGPVLEEQRAMAGTVPLRGAGIDILLDDSTTRKLLPSEDPDNYIVHEYQLRDIVNLLWGAGAAGISINGERVVNSTSIYCVGSTILINDTRTSPPYHVVAVGDTARMQAALEDGNRLRDLKARVDIYGLVLKVANQGTFTLPAFDGGIAMRHVVTAAAASP
jgi:uncharacterized protein YlxW (UPF0749 family)